MSPDQPQSLEYYQSLLQRHALPTNLIEHQEELLTLLESWQAPLLSHTAACFLPAAEHEPSIWEAVQPDLPDNVVNLVADWKDLHELILVPKVGIQDPSDARSLKLRRLMRTAYLNLPLLILTIADQATRVNARAFNSRVGDDKRFWKDIEVIFLPLLQMLGLWELRSIWVEICARRLYPEEYKAIREQLKRSLPTKKRCYESIREELDKLQGGGMQGRSELDRLSPGRILYKTRLGESLDLLNSYITITLLPPDRSSCYRALEAVHGLGEPIHGRFYDHIASPLANGYRSLHTAIIGDKNQPAFRHKLIEFKINSDQMHAINLWGIIETQWRHPKSDLTMPHGWWDLPEQSPKAFSLLQRYRVGQPADKEDQIYIFTPLGEVRSLPSGSTPLDFAYSLHTTIGHQCRRVEINGHAASHATE
jgi:GTP pyrophosphokinase